jgi:hypothetical protein
LGPGSIILPGNYGRIIRTVGEAHPLWTREQTLEEVRMLEFPHKPPRLDSAFAYTSLDTARFHMNLPQIRGQMFPILYEVEKVDEHAPEHRADYNVVQPLPRRPETMPEIARLYWTAGLWTRTAEAPNIRSEELVTLSPLRIVRML